MIMTVAQLKEQLEGLRDGDFVFADVWTSNHMKFYIEGLRSSAEENGDYCENISLADPTTTHRLMQCVPDAWAEHGDDLSELLHNALYAQFVHIEEQDESPE
jgi:ornithine carbamoyltransferase